MYSQSDHWTSPKGFLFKGPFQVVKCDGEQCTAFVVSSGWFSCPGSNTRPSNQKASVLAGTPRMHRLQKGLLDIRKTLKIFIVINWDMKIYDVTILFHNCHHAYVQFTC